MEDPLAAQRELYAKLNFSNRVGFGKRAAILSIDMMRGVTEPGPMYIDMEEGIAHMETMFAMARKKGVPIVHVRVARTPPDFPDGGVYSQKVPIARILVEGSPLSEIDPRLAPLPGEIVITKKFPSAFFATNMTSLLTYWQVDTVIVIGNSTSGCVRATCIDAVSHSYRLIVPRECVGDRAKLSHEVNLFDIDSKYGDVVPVSDVFDYLGKQPDSSVPTMVGMAAGSSN